jgi:hypothetical protein
MRKANLTLEYRILLNILTIPSVFVEYLEMGCNVTWSLIDTAEVFDSPLLPDVLSVMPVSELVKTVGSQNVK